MDYFHHLSGVAITVRSQGSREYIFQKPDEMKEKPSRVG